jgi:hypothetical protein
MSKQAIIRLLLRTYPATWRSEYGGELALMLASRPLTLSVGADVFFNGIRQRVRHAEVWHVGGATMGLWLIFGTALNSVSPLSQSAYNQFFRIEWWIELAIGYLYVSRYARHPAAAALASAKAALVGILPEVLLACLWAVNLVHPTILYMNGSPHIRGGGITDLCFRGDSLISPGKLLFSIPVTVLPAFLIGFAGGGIAKTVSVSRRLFQTQRS